MISLAVLETVKDGDITTFIADHIKKLKNHMVTFVGLSSIAAKAVPDIIVVSERFAQKSTLNTKGSCNYFLVPGLSQNLISNISAKSVFSYGMSIKDTITLSSIGETESVLSLQREVLTLTGKVLERQDVPIKHKSNYSPGDIMAASATLLLLGLPPEELM